MEREFGLSKSGKIIFVVCGIFGILFGVGFAPFILKFPGLIITLIFSPFAAGFLFLGVYLFMAVRRYKIKVNGSSIIEHGVFFSKTINLDDYEGFRIVTVNSTRRVLFIPRNQQGFNTNKTIKRKTLGLDYLENSETITEYIAGCLVSFDQKDIEDDYKTISENQNLGITNEERFAKLKGARRFVRILSFAILALIVGSFIFSDYRDYFIAVFAVLPFLLALMIPLSGGLIKFDTKNASLYPSVLPCFSYSWAALLLWSVAYLSWIMDWRRVIIPALVLTLLLFVVFLFAHRGQKLFKGTIIAFLFLSLIYGFGAALCLNDMGAHHVIERYPVTILDKRISRGRHTTYYLKVSAWGDRQKENEVTVGKTRYEEYEINDTVTVNVVEGKLDIPFYFVR